MSQNVTGQINDQIIQSELSDLDELEKQFIPPITFYHTIP